MVPLGFSFLIGSAISLQSSDAESSKINIRKSQERGFANHGWLQSYHTFSFADYYDPNHMGFRTLRVINEDHIDPLKGFGTHPHHDMEILTIVLKGTLTHKDSLGNTSEIRAGEVQLMSAGTGITHSEFNASGDESVHLLQIWISPNQKKIEPKYQQKSLMKNIPFNQWKTIVSPNGKENSLIIHQEASVEAASLEKGAILEKNLSTKNYGWLQLIKGKIKLNDLSLSTGDAAAVFPMQTLIVEAEEPSDLIWFDLN